MLVRQAQAGDVAAFTELVTRHQGLLRRRAYAITGNEDDARDIAQDALLIAWRRLDTFRVDSAFTSWLWVIVTRLALNHVARHRRHLPVHELGPHADRHAEVEAIAETNATAAAVRAALDLLPQPQARAITLHHLHGLSYAEVAEHTGTTVGSVRSHLHRGRQSLANTIKAWRSTEAT